jgi:hypothetical protein
VRHVGQSLVLAGGERLYERRKRCASAHRTPVRTARRVRRETDPVSETSAVVVGEIATAPLMACIANAATYQGKRTIGDHVPGLLKVM